MTSDGMAAGTPAKTPHTFEFRGSGGEYFRIWIVNVALTIVTLGIYSAWAKVRTVRYLRGNTFLAGHPFDYHASPVRILIGRIIAVTALFCYGITARFHPAAVIGWIIVFAFLTPWLVVSSLRFNARNTSYRNVRFNFVGTLGEAAWAYVLFPFLSLFTFLTILPLVHRARDYYFVNNHTFGGKHFFTQFSGWSIYRIYLIGFAAFLAVLALIVALGWASLFRTGLLVLHGRPSPYVIAIVFVLYLVFFVALAMIQIIVHTLSTNLALNNATLEGGHELRASLQPLPMAWITLSNLVLTLLTIGLFYPWARVRLVRYETSRLGVLAASNLDDFTSEAFATQGAIGEEIANFFDLGISL